jgi:hypothetical protein
VRYIITFLITMYSAFRLLSQCGGNDVAPSDRSEPGQSSLLACRAADSHANLQKMLRMAAGGDQISAPRVRQ